MFIERILDIFTIALMGIAAGYWSFRSGLPPEIQAVFGVAIVIVALLALALFTLRNFGRRLIVAPAAAGPDHRALRPVRAGRVRGPQARASCPGSSARWAWRSG